MHFGTSEAHINAHVLRSIEAMDVSQYQDARVIVKGCGKVELEHAAYGMVSLKLLPMVKTLMFREPCSTVPATTGSPRRTRPYGCGSGGEYVALVGS